MIQIKPIDQMHYKIYADKEYLVSMQFNGKAELYVCDDTDENYVGTYKHYTYLYTYSSLDNLLHCVYGRMI